MRLSRAYIFPCIIVAADTPCTEIGCSQWSADKLGAGVFTCCLHIDVRFMFHLQEDDGTVVCRVCDWRGRPERTIEHFKVCSARTMERHPACFPACFA